jgi:hypothetical protein
MAEIVEHVPAVDGQVSIGRAGGRMNAVDEFTGTGRIDLRAEAREHQGIGVVVDARLGLHDGRTAEWPTRTISENP